MPLKEYGLGSGLVLSPDGYILTNNHVVEGGGRLKVHLGDRRSFDARIVGVDPQSDLAVVKVEATNLVPAKFGDSKAVKVGQWVAAFGSPFGLDQTMSCGIVSAKSRANLHLVDDEDYLQTDAAINPGNSGGPLVNLVGEVVGINAAIVSRTGGYQGVGLAIPAHMAKDISAKLMRDGKVVRGWLGVSIQELTTDLARSFAAKTEDGVLVAEVVAGSPAARAGLVAGDIVVSVDGKPIEGTTMFRHAVADMRPGTKCLLVAWREGREVELWAEVSSAPRTGVGAVVDAAAKTYFGLELSDATTLKPGAWRLQEGRQAVVVTKVVADSCAERCGLQAGDILLQIERTKVRDAAQARDLLKGRTGDGAALLVERAGSTRWLHLDAVEGD
jgi:serine protease Do